jgi:hypothetical protein
VLPVETRDAIDGDLVGGDVYSASERPDALIPDIYLKRP